MLGAELVATYFGAAPAPDTLRLTLAMGRVRVASVAPALVERGGWAIVDNVAGTAVVFGPFVAPVRFDRVNIDTLLDVRVTSVLLDGTVELLGGMTWSATIEVAVHGD